MLNKIVEINQIAPKDMKTSSGKSLIRREFASRSQKLFLKRIL